MRLVRVIPFLMLVAFPVSLFAQNGSNNTGVSVESAFMGVENVAALGGFIGGGRPDAFVGRTEIYRASSGSSRSANTSRLAATPARARTTVASAVQRQTNRTAGASQVGNLNNQTIRSITSLDSDMRTLSIQKSVPALETQLTRLQGIQGSQVTFTGSTVVLTGTVASDRERRVAQQLLLLEPGINHVDNRLEVR